MRALPEYRLMQWLDINSVQADIVLFAAGPTMIQLHQARLLVRCRLGL
jgi:hypothetical protein